MNNQFWVCDFLKNHFLQQRSGRVDDCDAAERLKEGSGVKGDAPLNSPRATWRVTRAAWIRFEEGRAPLGRVARRARDGVAGRSS